MLADPRDSAGKFRRCFGTRLQRRHRHDDQATSHAVGSTPGPGATIRRAPVERSGPGALVYALDAGAMTAATVTRLYQRATTPGLAVPSAV